MSISLALEIKTHQMNSIRLDDDSARHAARLRDIFKESYVNDVRNYFSHQQQEIDWSAFVLAQMQVLLDTVNVKNFDKTDAWIVLNAFFSSKADFNVDMEITGLEIEADKNSLDALHKLADLYEAGIKVEKNATKAIAYLDRAASLNSTAAMVRLGIMYADGILVDKDLKKSFRYFQSSSELGNKYGQYNLGKFYEKHTLNEINDDEFVDDGYGELRKTTLSRVWITLAAEQGLANAQHDLAWSYHMDESFGIDYKIAFFWYKLAAAQGFLDSINNLGELFLNGQGVEKDPIAAYQWFHIASVHNDADALESLSELETILSASEIEQALISKQNWLAMHPIAKTKIYDT